MRSIQARVLSAALLVLGVGCAADSSGHSGPNAVVGSPVAGTGSGGVHASGTGGMAGVATGSGGMSGFGNTNLTGTGGRAPTMMAGTAGMGVQPKPPFATGTGGMGAPMGTGGMGAPMGTGGMGPSGMPAPAGSADPVIPEVTGECPTWQSGVISFMGLGNITLEVGAMPSTPSAPMVFYWHGTGSTSGEYAFMAAAVAQGVMQEGGILVSFQDTTGGDGLSGTAIFGMSDFELTDQLLACAVRDRNVDPRRVYATGCSAGGLFSVAMGAARSGYMAAVASNSGGFTFPPAWQNDHTPALMTVHGAAGVDVVGVDFSQTSATADMAYKARGAIAIDCDTGGMHCGGGGEAGDIWQFFKDHPFGVTPEPYATGLPASFNSICKIQ
jgi:hypothetical protein